MGRFSEIIEQSDFSVSTDISKNPDQFAADQDLATQTGLPVDYVERNREEAQKVKKQNVDFSKYADMELGASLTDPTFSNLAQDDLDNLSYLERTFKGLGTSISESFKQGAKGVALSAYDEGQKSALSGMMPSVYDPFVSDIFDERMGEGFMVSVQQSAADVAIESIKRNEEAIKAVTPEGLDVLQQGIRSGVQSLAQMAPGLAASIAARSSVPMLTTMGAQSYGGAYAKARSEGLSPEQSASYGMIDAAVEVATEKLPADKLLKITGEFGNQTLRNVVKFMVVEAGTEQVATFLQSLNALAFGLDEELEAAETAADQAKIHAERAAVTLIATVVAGGAQAGVAAGVGKTAEKLSGSKQQLQDMVASAEQSNLKRRSPEQFRSFLQSVDPLANIFIPASAFEGVQLDPANKTLAQVAAQLPQARALNGDIVVPVADVLTDIPADVFAQVAPFVRVEADGVAEIEGRPDMKELIEQVNRESEMAVQSKAFSDDLASQLTATARARPDEATKYAAMVSARIETLAVDNGMTFDEAKAKYIGELRVVGPEADLTGERVMEQAKEEGYEGSDPTEAAEWVSAKAKGLDMSKEARMQRAAEQGFDTSKVYYRGQLKPFEEGKIKNITWFTDSPEYADAYTISPTMADAFSGENIINAYLNKDKRFDFGYRTLKTDVKKSDVYERVQGGILEAYDRGLISKDKAKLLYKEADEKIKASGNDYKKVYEWYNEDPEIFRIIKESGFDHVTTKEGFADSYNAIGMLYPERMRSVNAAFDPAQKESPNLLAQSAVKDAIAEDKNLFVAHNLSESNLLHAIELGGLAAPSLAIAKAGVSDFSGYGEITLLAKPEIIESSKARTFNADAYSPRHPRARYKLDGDKQRAFVNSIKQDAKEAGDLRLPSEDQMEDEGPKDLQRSEALQYSWLKSKGIAPKIIKAKLPEHIADGVKIAKKIGVTAAWQLEEHPDFKKFANEHFKAESEKLTSRGRPDPFYDDGELDFRFVQRLARDVYRVIENNGVDTAEMQAAIAKKFRNKKLRDEFDAFAKQEFEKLHKGKFIFEGFTKSGNKKYSPYDLDNVVRNMTQALQAGEGFNYGAGNIRAAFAHEMKSVKEVKQWRDDIVSSEDFAKIKEESHKKVEEALEALKPFYKFSADSWGYSNDASSAIAEGSKGQAEAFRLTAESKKIIKDLIDYLRELPTEYFETKIQRAVSLSEFDTAVVPSDIGKEALQALKDAGLKIKKYKAGEQQSRKETIEKQNKLFFQSAPQTETPEFKAWFGDSKVVDENGKPLVVYHGGTVGNVFDKAASGAGGGRESAFFFTPDIRQARDYAGSAEVKAVFLKLENPLITDVQLDPDEARAAIAAGHDGYWLIEDGNVEESEIAVFEPTQIKSAIGNRGTFDPNDPNILNQKERGLISISDKEIVIKLTEASNRSTFIHEAGHLFLEIESRIAKMDGITDGQRKMLAWLGVKSFDEIGVEQHEKFARGFEAYAMEGHAPSKDLVDVFRSFARWLKKVYASMKQLDVELNDDIRQFFDRMLAADQAVKEAERLTQYKALFKDAKSAGMTEQEFADYQANQAKAQAKGGEELQSKLLKELTRQTEKWWKEELKAEKEKAAESVGKQPIYQATAFLTGKTKLEGFDVHKMDIDAVKAMLGVEKKKPEKRYRPEAYVDPRLKRENYRGFLDALVNRDLLSVKEGNLALVVDNTQKGESDSGETKYKRTSSVNPEWFQQFNKENTPVSVDQARIIVKKALAGDRLGVNQARFVVAALDEITGKRSDYADTLRRQREFIREERKRIAEDMPVPEDWISYDEIAKAGEVYKPDQYLADADYIDRSLSEIGYSAILNGVDESVVFDIIDTKSTIEAIESIQKLLKEKADEQGYITQASTGERSDQGMAEEETGKGGKQREKTGLEKFRGMLAKGGLSPDEVAAMFDFASGQDLVDTIASSPTFNEATAAAANQAMIDKHGDILNDGTLQQEAQLAAHNEERGKLILAELRALTRKVGKEAINRDALKFSAKEVIGRTPLKDIHPGKYRTAEVRAAKESATALAKKDYAAAAQAKLKQAANFYLYREAMDAKRKEQSWRRYLSAVPNRKYSTKDVHPDYIKQMRLLASVYDFRRSPDPATLSGIGVWIKAQQEAPDADIAPTVMDVNLSRAMEATAKGEPVQVKNYREMTLDELQGVYDMVRHLRWVGGQLSENEKVRLQAEYEKVAKSIAEHGGEIVEVPREPTKRSRALSGLRQFGQDHLALANQIEELDGFEQFGPAFNLVYQGIIDSSNTELKFRRETSEKVNALFKDFGSSDFAEGKGEETITTEDGRKFTLSRRARVMLALYWGSPDSRAAIMDGDGLTANDVNKMLATLTGKELDLVDSIWKLNESFWPDLARVSKAMTGIVPAKVEHVPFAVNGRVMSGGYMRLFYMYDQRDSVQMVDTEGASITRSGSRIVTQTKHGARHERVGSGGRKVDLNVNNVFRALDEVIHDISFAETARATMRAMRNPEVSGAIINHYGKEKYESITSSLEGIIAGNVSNSHPINNFIKHFRTAATYSMLGYSLRNAVQQPVALTNMFGRIGEVETIGAMYDFIVNRNKWGKFVQDRSEFMKNRTSLVNREVAEIMGKISGNVMSSGLKQHAFDLQTIGDSMIAYPGWLAAYRKGLKEFGSEQKAIIYADESVSATIGSGLMKDMSPMLQGSGRLAQTVGPEMLKSITFMGSYFNVIGRLIYSATKQADFKSVRGVASYTRTMTWYLAAPAILSALLVGQGPDDDESWIAWSAKSIASYGFAAVFMLRDLVSAASGFTPSSAWSRALDASIRASKGIKDVATGEKDGDMEDIAKILRSTSYLYPLPGAGQAARTLEYIGSQEAGNEGDFNIYKAIVVGKDRD